MTEVKNAYETLLNSQEIVQLYNNGYLQQAQQSLDIAQFSYQHGAASLLDFLDAERSYYFQYCSSLGRDAQECHQISKRLPKIVPRKNTVSDRGRDVGCPAPPARIRASAR
jgi:hypothetical protein